MYSKYPYIALAFKWGMLLMEATEGIFPAIAYVDLSNCGNLKCQKCQKEDTFQPQLSLDDAGGNGLK